MTATVLSPNRSSRGGVAIDAIVLHDTRGRTAASALSWFSSPQSGVSSHYLIDRDGTVTLVVPEDEKAWHAGDSVLFGRPGVNRFSIGIELVQERDSDGYPPAQLAMLADLCADCCRRHRIPLNRMVGHEHIAPGRKTDPGGDLDFYSLLLRIAMLIGPGSSRPASS